MRGPALNEAFDLEGHGADQKNIGHGCSRSHQYARSPSTLPPQARCPGCSERCTRKRAASPRSKPERKPEAASGRALGWADGGGPRGPRDRRIKRATQVAQEIRPKIKPIQVGMASPFLRPSLRTCENSRQPCARDGKTMEHKAKGVIMALSVKPG